jgi:uncharacterized protein YuzE
MEAESYYTGLADGDIAYIAVRHPNGAVRSEEEPWGLRDYDRETGELVGLEVWSASTALSADVLGALPRLEGRSDAVVTREDLAKPQPA